MILVVSIGAIGRWLSYGCRRLPMDQYANFALLYPKCAISQTMKVREVSVIMRSSPGADPASKIKGGTISVIFSSQVSLRVYFVRGLKYTSQHRCDNKIGRQNGLIWRMLFSELYKIVVKKVTFVGFKEDRPNRPHWIRTPTSTMPSKGYSYRNFEEFVFCYSCNLELFFMTKEWRYRK